MAEHKGILICGEIIEGKIATITKELIQTGRRLSGDLKQPMNLLLFGSAVREAAGDALALGADVVYTVESASFEESVPEQSLAIITTICKQSEPSLILLGQTDMGRDLAPRLAARLGTTACLDSVNLSLDSETKSLLLSKPVYGGNAVAIWKSVNFRPQVVTLRPRSSPPAESDISRKGKIVPIKVAIEDFQIKSRLLEYAKGESRGVKLEEAKVIVAGGGGIGGREGFQLLDELAKILGGAVGISRVPADEGWMPSSLEIGQTGYVVRPDLYIAVGISGAPQHLAGCSGSKCIVAINKDPNAHIFKEADFGIIADYREALPPFIEKCRSLLSI